MQLINTAPTQKLPPSPFKSELALRQSEEARHGRHYSGGSYYIKDKSLSLYMMTPRVTTAASELCVIHSHIPC